MLLFGKEFPVLSCDSSKSPKLDVAFSMAPDLLYICFIRVCLLFLNKVCNIIFGLGVKVCAFSPGGTNSTAVLNNSRYISLKLLNYTQGECMSLTPRVGLFPLP